MLRVVASVLDNMVVDVARVMVVKTAIRTTNNYSLHTK